MNSCIHVTRKKLLAARGLENHNNAFNVMSFLHETVFAFIFIECHNVLLPFAIGLVRTRFHVGDMQTVSFASLINHLFNAALPTQHIGSGSCTQTQIKPISPLQNHYFCQLKICQIREVNFTASWELNSLHLKTSLLHVRWNSILKKTVH